MRKSFVIGFFLVLILIAVGAYVVSVRTRGIPLPFGDRFPVVSSATGTSDLPILTERMPEFSKIAAWIDSPPLTPADLKGKVVLVDFWTYSCINCIRTLPYVTSWQEKYGGKGFTVVGVHTPEFAFEKVEANVRQAVARFHVTYPVALDNDYGTWNNYYNEFWPAHYLFDAEGRLRAYKFGEGGYDETEREIQALLAEAGHPVEMAVTSATSTTDFGKIVSKETYLGYARQEFLISPERVVHDAPGRYSVAKTAKQDRFSFGGIWTVESERAVAGADARIVYRYSASEANLVMSGNDGTHRAEVTLDGAPVPEAFRGADVQAGADGKTYVDVSDERLYELTDGKGNYGAHTLVIRFLDAGAAAYAFTFG